MENKFEEIEKFKEKINEHIINNSIYRFISLIALSFLVAQSIKIIGLLVEIKNILSK